MKQFLLTIILLSISSVTFGQPPVKLHLKEAEKELIYSQNGKGSIKVINEEYNLTTYKGFEVSEKGSTERKVIVRNNEMKIISEFEYDAWGELEYPSGDITEIDYEKMDYYVFNFSPQDSSKKDLVKFNLKTGARQNLNIPELQNRNYKISKVNNGIILGGLIDEKKWFTYNFESKELKILPLPIFYYFTAINLNGNGYLLSLNGTKTESFYYRLDKNFNLTKILTLKLCQNKNFIYPSAYLLDDNGDLIIAGYAKEMKKPEQNNSINKKGKRLQSPKYTSVFLTRLTMENTQTTNNTPIKDIECIYYKKGTVTSTDNKLITPKQSKIGKLEGDSYFHRAGDELLRHNGSYVFSHSTMSKKTEYTTSPAIVKTGTAATSGETQYETTSTNGGYTHHEIYSYHFQNDGSLIKTVKVKQGYQDGSNSPYRISFSIASSSKSLIYILSTQNGNFYSVINYDNDNFRSSLLGKCEINTSKSTDCNEISGLPTVRHIVDNKFIFGISIQIKENKGLKKYYYTGRLAVE